MTGSGKGRDLILPNLAHVNGRSLVVLDMKDGENAYASVNYRATLGAGCIYLNPFGLHGLPNTRINPSARLSAFLEPLSRIGVLVDSVNGGTVTETTDGRSGRAA